jgi:aminoglycoside 3-N-acetyltransferase
MQLFIYNLLRKYLSQKSRNKLKASVFKLRIKSKKLLRLIYSSTGDEELINHIVEKLGIDYEILMIHSSFNDMIPMYTGNFNQLLNKIIEYCIENQITLAMPAFFFGAEEFDAAKYYKDNFFDVKNTISQMGIFTELFRGKPGVQRSIHPTHSICALGPLAKEITKTHHLAETTTGKGTPFGYMSEYDTKIFGIGTKYFRVITQIHTAEDLMGKNYPIKFKPKEIINVPCILNDGSTINYHLPINSREYETNASKFKKIFRDAKIEHWTYKGIPMFLTEAKNITETVIKAAKKGLTIYKKN